MKAFETFFTHSLCERRYRIEDKAEDLETY